MLGSKIYGMIYTEKAYKFKRHIQYQFTKYSDTTIHNTMLYQ